MKKIKLLLGICFLMIVFNSCTTDDYSDPKVLDGTSWQWTSTSQDVYSLKITFSASGFILYEKTDYYDFSETLFGSYAITNGEIILNPDEIGEPDIRLIIDNKKKTLTVFGASWMGGDETVVFNKL